MKRVKISSIIFAGKQRCVQSGQGGEIIFHISFEIWMENCIFAIQFAMGNRMSGNAFRIMKKISLFIFLFSHSHGLFPHEYVNFSFCVNPLNA